MLKKSIPITLATCFVLAFSFAIAPAKAEKAEMTCQEFAKMQAPNDDSARRALRKQCRDVVRTGQFKAWKACGYCDPHGPGQQPR